MKKDRRDFINKIVLAGLGISTLNITQNVFSSTGKKVDENYSQFAQRNNERRYYKDVAFIYADDLGGLTKKAIDIFKRIFKERTGFIISDNENSSLKIKLLVNPKSVPKESFRIKYSEDNNISISANDENGILYGIGKLLHTSTLNENGFSPGKWEGISTPKKKFRGITITTHFYNFYHVAPIEEVKRYIEELALWGYNHLVNYFDMHPYDGINDVEAQKMLDRLADLYKIGKSLGMKVFSVSDANQGFNNSPEHLRATKTGKFFYGDEICPSIEEGSKLILKQFREEFSEFEKRGVVFDGLVLWPYDAGGCGCDMCKPWGSNGFVNISERIANELRNNYPKLEICLGTWLFDYGKDQGEWKGLADRFEKQPPQWVNYLLADSHTTYPKYLLENKVPGNLSLLNFPEISMWGQWPYGGFGANPLPNRFQKLWAEGKDKVLGGFAYSEGIYEDINKVLYSQFYWHEDINYKEVLNEYISFEYSEKYVKEITEVMEILEKNHGLSTWKWYENPEYGKIDVPDVDFGSKKAYLSLKNIDQKLPSNVRNGWRWRILLIRAMMDYELRLSKGKINKNVESGLLELFTLYHAGNCHEPQVIPPINNGAIYKISDDKKKNSPR